MKIKNVSAGVFIVGSTHIIPGAGFVELPEPVPLLQKSLNKLLANGKLVAEATKQKAEEKADEQVAASPAIAKETADKATKATKK